MARSRLAHRRRAHLLAIRAELTFLGIIRHGDHDQSDHNPYGGGGGSSKSDARSAVPLSATDPSLSSDERAALREYGQLGPTVEEVNSGLRNGNLDPELMREVVEPIDSVMDRSQLRSSITVDRGIYDIDDVISGGSEEDLTGAQWTERAFSSTTVNESEAVGFATGGPNPAVLSITAPAGTGAVRLVDKEGEILLDRDLSMRVSSDHGTDDAGIRRLDVVVE